MQGYIHTQKSRNLSLTGKILIIKIPIIHAVALCTVLNVPKEIIEREWIKCKTLIVTIENGGVNMINIFIYCQFS